jgi:hypothetical protein
MLARSTIDPATDSVCTFLFNGILEPQPGLLPVPSAIATKDLGPRFRLHGNGELHSILESMRPNVHRRV